MIVYHGSTQLIKRPDTVRSQRLLDFGKGFYVTSNMEQAQKWARRKAILLQSKSAVLNVYRLEDIPQHFSVKTFDDNLSEWIDFVCKCRDGSEAYKAYDIISGKVADDKVFRVVDMYRNGIWDKERALREIKAYPSYDQTAFISQAALDELLVFMSAEEV